MSRRRRSFAAVRRLSSGRWQALYRDDHGRLRSAPTTFMSRVDTERFLAQMDLERVRGGWVDPDAGAVPLATYVEQWLVERPELTARNPCRLRHAGAERPEERRPPSSAEVDAIAAAIEPRFRALVLLGAWPGLRYGELAGLTRQRIDPLYGVIHVREQPVQTADGRRFLAAPKTNAGVRTVAVPPHLWPEIETHLATYVDHSPTALLFVGPKGASLDRLNLRNVWLRTLREAGAPAYRFHDLRHLAATLAAVSGATKRELMSRLGHSSPRAAMIYQHATADRDRAVAEAMSRLVVPSAIRLPSVVHGQA